MRLKALVEIYTMHSFAQLQNHIFFKKLVEFAKICENFQKFCKIRNIDQDYQAEIFAIGQIFANFARFQICNSFVEISQKLLIFQTDFLRKF